MFISQVLSNISSSLCSNLLPNTGLWHKQRSEHPLVLYRDSYVTEWSRLIILSVSFFLGGLLFGEVNFGLLFFHWHFPTRTARNGLEALKDFKNKNFSWRLFSARSLIQVRNLSLWLNDYHQLEGKRNLLLKKHYKNKNEWCLVYKSTLFYLFRKVQAYLKLLPWPAHPFAPDYLLSKRQWAHLTAFPEGTYSISFLCPVVYAHRTYLSLRSDFLKHNELKSD